MSSCVEMGQQRHSFNDPDAIMLLLLLLLVLVLYFFVVGGR